MERVTRDEIRQIVIDRNITMFPTNICAKCHLTSHYEFNNDVVSFHSGCEFDSSITYCDTPSRLSSYEAVAVTFNRLTPKDRLALWNIFVLLGDTLTITQQGNVNVPSQLQVHPSGG